MPPTNATVRDNSAALILNRIKARATRDPFILTGDMNSGEGSSTVRIYKGPENLAPAEAAKFGLPAEKPLFVVIWTTTPWTIPSNLAIAFHPEFDYVALQCGDDVLVVADGLKESFLKAGGANFSTVPCLNDSVLSVDMLETIVHKELSGWL